MTKRTTGRQAKPAKPWPEFPLYAHAGGVWAKRILGRLHYFGPWSDPHGALDRYLAARDHLYAGRAVPADSEGTTLDELVNRFLASKAAALALGELSRRQWLDYRRDGKRLLDTLGRARPVASLCPTDFARLRAAVSAGRNATTVANIIGRIRAIFRWGADQRLLSSSVEYGGELSPPSAKARRRALRASGPKMFEADELRKLLAAAARHPNLHAMIYLGINAALGNTDCAEMRLKHIDLDAGRLDYTRAKTETDRRAALWPETVAALAIVLDSRKRLDVPAGLADRVFVSDRGCVYVRMRDETDVPIDSIGTQFAKLCRRLGLHRRGRGFYALRHTFRTIADETKDFPAIDLVMGHTASDGQGAPFSVGMADRYRERIGDDRLRAVSDHVRAWLLNG